jgi:hypothetical protein
MFRTGRYRPVKGVQCYNYLRLHRAGSFVRSAHRPTVGLLLEPLGTDFLIGSWRKILEAKFSRRKALPEIGRTHGAMPHVGACAYGPRRTAIHRQ